MVIQKWKQFEKKLGKEFEGKRQKGSGNLWHTPGDISNKKFLIEAKQTSKFSYSISRKTWQKIYNEALFSYRLPLLALLLGDIELVILDKNDFLQLIKDLK